MTGPHFPGTPEGSRAGILAIDVDGTLITDHGVITDRVRGALERASSAGWEVIVATGRTLHAARPIIESLPFVRYALLSNGSTVMDFRGGEIFRLETIPPDFVRAAIGIFRKHGVVPVLYNSDVNNQKMFFDTVEGACEYFQDYVENDPRSTQVRDILEWTRAIQQIGSIAPREMIFGLRDELSDGRVVPMTLPFESPKYGGKNHEFWFIQVIPAGISKIGAVRLMEARLGIPSGKVVAVGDNYNDADMIVGADVGVAMGNAPEEIRRLAKVVVGTNNDSGIADVVEEVIFSGKYFQ